MKRIAIIPARGISNRIPKKNIKDFLGKPIIAYSIEKAINFGGFDEVMVSTGDTVIAEVAKIYGAKVPFFRSKQAIDDYATLANVINDVKFFYKKLNRSFDKICCIFATSPLINQPNLVKGLEVLTKSIADSVMPVVRFSYRVQRVVKMNNGKIELFYPDYKTTRSQNLEPAFHDAGQFYWMKNECGLRGKNKVGFEIPEMLGQDIDNLDDWKSAELKYQYQLGKKS